MTCRICTNARDNARYTAREMMYGLREEFAYFQCARCGCLQIAEFPAEMAPYYPAHYYSLQPYDGKKFRGALGGLKKAQYRAAIRRRGPLDMLLNLLLDVPDYRLLHGLNLGPESQILDVGCGNGRSFLYPLAEIGFGEVEGCDPYLAEPIAYANGLHIHRAGIAEMTGAYDLITYHHAFEHVPDPLEQMRQVARLLRPHGVCLIRIPKADSWAWEHYRTNWAQLDAPRHFFLHTAESLRHLAGSVGLELYRVIDDSRHFQFSGSEKYLADIPLSAPRPKGLGPFLQRKYRKAQYTRRAGQLNRAGRGDQGAFFFRQKS